MSLDRGEALESNFNISPPSAFLKSGGRWFRLGRNLLGCSQNASLSKPCPIVHPPEITGGEAEADSLAVLYMQSINPPAG